MFLRVGIGVKPGGSLMSGGGEANGERGAALGAVPRLDRAAVGLDQFSGDGQPDAAARARLGARTTVEALEHVREVLGRDAGAGVEHVEERLLALDRGPNGDRPPGGGGPGGGG